MRITLHAIKRKARRDIWFDKEISILLKWLLYLKSYGIVYNLVLNTRSKCFPSKRLGNLRTTETSWKCIIQFSNKIFGNLSSLIGFAKNMFRLSAWRTIGQASRTQRAGKNPQRSGRFHHGRCRCLRRCCWQCQRIAVRSRSVCRVVERKEMDR